MSKRKQEEKHLNAKQRAYEKKQAQQGEKVVKWIFIVLIIAAVAYMGYTMWLMR
jgi:flagellar basal body-associated protein FliL